MYSISQRYRALARRKFDYCFLFGQPTYLFGRRAADRRKTLIFLQIHYVSVDCKTIDKKSLFLLAKMKTAGTEDIKYRYRQIDFES